MHRLYRPARWAVVSAVLAALWHGGAAPGQRAVAQAPSANGKIPTKLTTFKLPVQIDERARGNLKEIRLYVKHGADDWQVKDTAPPSQTVFTYKVAGDGEYWFSVVTVYKNGQVVPADVRREPPGLMVVVDTQLPQLDVQVGPGPGGEQCLRCTVKDANPDPGSLKASYRGPDGNWRPLEPLSGGPGLFRLPQDPTALLRVTGADQAKNVGTREMSLRDTGVAQASYAPSADPPPATPNLLPQDPPAQPARTLQAEPTGPALPPAPVQTAAARPSFENPPAAPARVPAPALNPAGGKRQVLATTRASLEYRLDQVGPSGIGKVEVWLTNDEGRNWQRLCEDTDLRSPAEFELPGEGVFGLRLVVANGNGFGGSPPARGDAPSAIVEVDTTRPHAHVRDIEPQASGGTLELRWTASDKNLGSEPISLYYATRREGPWQQVSRGLKNEGAYRWAFPRDQGSQFFVRLEVTDLAGNVTRCEPAAPVMLDMTVPQAQVVGVIGVTPRAAPPSGN